MMKAILAGTTGFESPMCPRSSGLVLILCSLLAFCCVPTKAAEADDFKLTWTEITSLARLPLAGPAAAQFGVLLRGEVQSVETGVVFRINRSVEVLSARDEKGKELRLSRGPRPDWPLGSLMMMAAMGGGSSQSVTVRLDNLPALPAQVERMRVAMNVLIPGTPVQVELPAALTPKPIEVVPGLVFSVNSIRRTSSGVTVEYAWRSSIVFAPQAVDKAASKPRVMEGGMPRVSLIDDAGTVSNSRHMQGHGGGDGTARAEFALQADRTPAKLRLTTINRVAEHKVVLDGDGIAPPRLHPLVSKPFHASKYSARSEGYKLAWTEFHCSSRRAVSGHKTHCRFEFSGRITPPDPQRFEGAAFPPRVVTALDEDGRSLLENDVFRSTKRRSVPTVTRRQETDVGRVMVIFDPPRLPRSLQKLKVEVDAFEVAANIRADISLKDVGRTVKVAPDLEITIEQVQREPPWLRVRYRQDLKSPALPGDYEAKPQFVLVASNGSPRMGTSPGPGELRFYLAPSDTAETLRVQWAKGLGQKKLLFEFQDLPVAHD